MKISEMNSREFLVFNAICGQLGISTTSTEGLKDAIEVLKNRLEDEKSENQATLSKAAFKQYLKEYEFKKELYEEAMKITLNIEEGQYE